MTKISDDPQDYIEPININGLKGRMLRVPGPKANVADNKEILILYGHHALLERWWSLVQNYQQYGNVTLPDLPGFGGMDSFYKIGRRPDVDAFADYLAAFIKLRYKRKKVAIVAISYGFVIATRMLQNYPELVKKVDLLVSTVGFMHHDDFHFTPRQRRFYRFVTRLFATRPVAIFIRYFCLNSFVITKLYARLPAGKKRFIEVGPEEFGTMITFEVVLWQANDVRTHWLTTSEFLTLDNCKKQIDLPVWHVASGFDHYFNNHNVEQHMLVVFTDYTQALTTTKAHTPSVIASKKEMAVLLPKKLRQELAKRNAS
jgi:pimeloyl-ACP methyl ester carboxylesterase